MEDRELQQRAVLALNYAQGLLTIPRCFVAK